jgi:hypothetical protein
MNMGSIARTMAVALVGLAIAFGTAVSLPRLAAPPETVMGARPDLGPLLLAA